MNAAVQAVPALGPVAACEALGVSRASLHRLRNPPPALAEPRCRPDRKSTRLNSSHLGISYAVFCLKKKRHNQASAIAEADIEFAPRIGDLRAHGVGNLFF